MPARRRKAVPPAPGSGLSAGGIFDGSEFSSLKTAGLEPGTLTLVSLPVGNLEDISLRALRVLKAVAFITAENPVRTRALLRRYAIETPVRGFRDRGDISIRAGIIDALRAGDTGALVCDAGTPLIADAGALLVQSALAAGVRLAAVPGPVAAMAALVIAGSGEQRFAFDGFPPRTSVQRAAFFAGLAGERRTILLYETRCYLPDTLRRLGGALGSDRRILVARDITKTNEALFRGMLDEAVHRFQDPPRGEYTLVISPSR